jgi:hypothetical protein
MGAPQGRRGDEVLNFYIAVTALVILIMVSITAWYYYNQWHAQVRVLETRLNKLEERYQSLLAQYQILASNSTLAVRYLQLQSEYHNLVNAFGTKESYTAVLDMAPGGSIIFPIVVPNNCNATVTITASSIAGSTVYTYVANISSMDIALSTFKAPSMLHKWSGSYIEEQVVLGSGVYIITVSNPATGGENPIEATVSTSLECPT